LAPTPIIAADKAFSSNRFAWTRRVRKVDLEVELKEVAMYQLLGSIVEMQSSDRPCSHGCHGIAEAVLVIEVGAADIRLAIHPHPTLSETIWHGRRTVRRNDHQFLRAQEEIRPERTS
jgi:hypothetical protein